MTKYSTTKYQKLHKIDADLIDKSSNRFPKFKCFDRLVCSYNRTKNVRTENEDEVILNPATWMQEIDIFLNSNTALQVRLGYSHDCNYMQTFEESLLFTFKEEIDLRRILLKLGLNHTSNPNNLFEVLEENEQAEEKHLKFVGLKWGENKVESASQGCLLALNLCIYLVARRRLAIKTKEVAIQKIKEDSENEKEKDTSIDAKADNENPDNKKENEERRIKSPSHRNGERYVQPASLNTAANIEQIHHESLGSAFSTDVTSKLQDEDHFEIRRIWYAFPKSTRKDVWNDTTFSKNFSDAKRLILLNSIGIPYFNFKVTLWFMILSFIDLNHLSRCQQFLRKLLMELSMKMNFRITLLLKKTKKVKGRILSLSIPIALH